MKPQQNKESLNGFLLWLVGLLLFTNIMSLVYVNEAQRRTHEAETLTTVTNKGLEYYKKMYFETLEERIDK